MTDFQRVLQARYDPWFRVPIEWVISKQHPTRPEISRFPTSSPWEARSYRAAGWSVTAQAKGKLRADKISEFCEPWFAVDPELARTQAIPPAGSAREQEMAMAIRRIVSTARRDCKVGSSILARANEAWGVLCRLDLQGSPLRERTRS